MVYIFLPIHAIGREGWGEGIERPMNSLARALRKNSTEAERCLWNRLRGRRLDGVKFRRQQVLGPYVVDFLCLEPKVLIEVDGGQHAEEISNDL